MPDAGVAPHDNGPAGPFVDSAIEELQRWRFIKAGVCEDDGKEHLREAMSSLVLALDIEQSPA